MRHEKNFSYNFKFHSTSLSPATVDQRDRISVFSNKLSAPLEVRSKRSIFFSQKSIEILSTTEEFKYEMAFYNMVKQEFDEVYKKSYQGHKKLRYAKVNYNKIYWGKGNFGKTHKDQFRGWVSDDL